MKDNIQAYKDYIEKGTVLFVTDSMFDNMLVTQILTMAGYRVIIANTGPRGVRMAKEHLPDLVLMDYNIPIMNGGDTADVIKDLEMLRNVPIVAHTTHYSPHEDGGKFISSCEGFIPKPAKKDEFVGMLESYLKQA
ncbi:MAG: response regulator [Desulfobacteraceae bacterium]|nr:response regulator [Desulfobacteraceae bacterium]